MNQHLQYFYALVQHGSFTEAAEEMFISQSALSQHIKALEEELGVKLIERSGRKLKLSEAGAYFYDHSRMVFRDYERICTETARIANRGQDALSVGYLRSCDGLEVHHTVYEFLRRHPDAVIETVEAGSDALFELLELGKIDIALCEQSEVEQSRLIRYPIVTVNFLVELSASHPLAQQDSVSMEELKYMPGILVANGAERDRELKHFKETHGFPNSFLFADTLRSARMLAVSGKGFLPMDGLGDPEYLQPSIQRVNLYAEGRPVLHPYCGYWKISNDKASIKEFVDILRAQFPHRGS